MKKILEFKLKILAKIILAKYKPEIIGITGSVGKTSTKEAIYAVLKQKYRVRKNVKNYNNEIGLPLTIIGTLSGGRSLIKWLAVFFRAGKLILFRDKSYPEILILEMGVDRPGDMKYLTGIVSARVGVVTNIGTVHAEFFDSIEGIQKEKGELIKSVAQGGWSIINYDDPRTRAMRDLSRARILTYGLEKKALVRAEEIRFSFRQTGIKGLSFKLIYNGSVVPVMLNNILSQAMVYNALAAAAVGISYGLNLLDISRGLDEFKSPPGRMNLINGIKDCLIIDDTYNAEPKSVNLALETEKIIPVPEGARRFAVLGDMLELGRYSEEGHQEVGRTVFAVGIDKLIVVGERARDIARASESAGMKKDDVFRFATPEEAGLFLQDRIGPGDLILIKGSQSMRMEKIVKEIMAEPLRASELLVRQDKEWQTKK